MGRQVNEWVADASHYLQIVAVFMVSFFIAVVLWSAADREPPFKILPHDQVIIKAGSHVEIDLPVWRDYSRTCDVRYDRYLFHSGGARLDLTVGAYVSDEMIRSLTPGQMRITFDAPPLRSDANPGGVIPGAGAIVAPLRYYCTKGHILFPIELTTVIPVAIVP